jgi:hypothetical protein
MKMTRKYPEPTTKRIFQIFLRKKAYELGIVLLILLYIIYGLYYLGLFMAQFWYAPDCSNYSYCSTFAETCDSKDHSNPYCSKQSAYEFGILWTVLFGLAALIIGKIIHTNWKSAEKEARGELK